MARCRINSPLRRGRAVARLEASGNGLLGLTVVAIPKSATSVQWRLKTFHDTGDSGQRVERNFCLECGSPIASDVAVMPELTFIKAGTLDDATWLDPKIQQVYCDSAQRWTTISQSSSVLERTSRHPAKTSAPGSPKFAHLRPSAAPGRACPRADRPHKNSSAYGKHHYVSHDRQECGRARHASPVLASVSASAGSANEPRCGGLL
jgi:hypothetical protein